MNATAICLPQLQQLDDDIARVEQLISDGDYRPVKFDLPPENGIRRRFMVPVEEARELLHKRRSTVLESLSQGRS